MTRRIFVMIAAVILAATAVIPVASWAGIAEDEAAIRQIWVDYQTARVDGDPDKWLGLWDEAGLQLPPGRLPATKARLDEVIPQKFQPGIVKTMEITPEEIVVTGDWAYSRGTYASDRLNADGADIHIEGKFMTIHKRQDDGTWKIYRDMFNANPQ